MPPVGGERVSKSIDKTAATNNASVAFLSGALGLSLTFAAAWPCMTRCQWSAELMVGSWGSVPMAVGYKITSAPCSAMARAASGNHWSQQMATPTFPTLVFHTLNPVSPGLK
jgi:hypothetical protein